MRVEIGQEGRSRAGREGLGWSTQAAESGVRAGRSRKMRSGVGRLLAWSPGKVSVQAARW